MTLLYDLVLAPTGIKSSQLMALRAIEEVGEIAQWEFARKHCVAVETLSRRFAVLRKKGFVKVRIGAKHGKRLYSLTEEGKRMLEQIGPIGRGPKIA